MTQLRFTGRSDGERLLLVDRSGREYTLVVDARLRTALRAAPESNGQLEIQMESTLRPRDIQSRIRAGESPDSVARAAGTTVDRIMAFAAPVLAERIHIAGRAQLSSVRRRSGETGARTLGEAVTAQMREHHVDPDAVEWDAYRREDGRWTVTGEYAADDRTGTATFSFDPRGNFVTVDDDDAHWLIGEAIAPEAARSAATRSGSASGPGTASGPSDDLSMARQRRLSAVPADELPLGDDAIEMVADGSDPESDVDVDSDVAVESGAVSGSGDTLSDTEDTTEIPSADLASHEPGPSDTPDTAQHPTEHTTDEDRPEEQRHDPAAAEPPAKPPTKKRGRASVPSWDEIMFGGGKND